MAINTHQGVNIDGGWIIYRNSINAFRTVLTGLDTSSIVFSMEFYTPGGTTAKLTLTESGGAITNDDAGTIDYSLSVANLESLPRDRYFFVIKYTTGGNTYPLAQGYTNITSETNPGTTTTSVTIPVSVSSTQINMSVTMVGGSGGGGTWGSITGTLSDQTDLQAALDALEDITIISVTDASSLTSSAFQKLHICTGTTADYTVDLPTAVGNDGGIIVIKGSSALTKVVTIQGVSGQTIDGESNRKLSSCGLLVLTSNGANWIVVNEVGSWIPYTTTFSGFSVDPTLSSCEYFRQGKMCTVRVIPNGSGTSSATTFTFTLPFNAADVTYCLCPLIVSSSLTTTPGMAVTRIGANTVDVYKDSALGTWSATGNKRATIILTFRIQ